MPLGERFDTVLAAARDGAEWAWAALYRDLAGPVTGYLRSRGACEPEDVASEVFLQVARGIDGFEGDENSFRSWVFVIAHRRLIDERRAATRRPNTRMRLSPEDMNLPGGDVEDEAIDRLAADELRAAFERLTEDQRDVLALRVIGDLTLKETAKVLGKRVGAVKALQRRGLIALKKDETWQE